MSENEPSVFFVTWLSVKVKEAGGIFPGTMVTVFFAVFPAYSNLRSTVPSARG